MNPLTQIKNTQKISKQEIELGLSDKSSWHDRFKHSAYIFVGGLAFNLTEGDLLAIFAQYGEIVDVNLCRDRKTGKPRGFAFLAYEDQRSTVLAVDNLSGSKVGGRIIRVEHVDNYKRKKAEMEGEPDPGSGDEDAQPDYIQREEQLRTSTSPARRNGASADEPWAASDSVFSLLHQRASPSTKEAKKEKKHKKKRWDDSSRSPQRRKRQSESRSISRERHRRH